MQIGLLISGDLGNAALCHFIKNYILEFVMTDDSSEEIIKSCNDKKIPLFIGNPRFEKINYFIKDKKCDIIISINYMFIIKKNVINIAKGLCFNIHGSLLPKYRGRTPHVWAIINNEEITGITAHIIDEGCDTGPIIEQIKVAINKEDTGWDILEKYKKLYIPLVESVLNKYSNNKLDIFPQDEKNATIFPKRTPDDGLINWNWNSKRIINWVRAQSKPYPGAFSFYNNKKIIIDKVSKLKMNYDKNLKNGTIILINPLIIKTCDAALKIEKSRNNLEEIKINEILT